MNNVLRIHIIPGACCWDTSSPGTLAIFMCSLSEKNKLANDFASADLVNCTLLFWGTPDHKETHCNLYCYNLINNHTTKLTISELSHQKKAGALVSRGQTLDGRGWVSEQALYGQWTRLSLFRRESGHARLQVPWNAWLISKLSVASSKLIAFRKFQ